MVVREVSRGTEKIKLSYVRSVYLRVALLGKFRSDETFKLLSDDCSIGFPKNKALTEHIVDVEQSHISPKSAVVSLFCFLDLVEVILEFIFACESSTVNSLKLLVG